MLLHSAGMTGAATDDEVITALALQMLPLVSAQIPYERLDEVYTRLITAMMLDPSTPSVMVTAHGFLSTWNTIQAEEAAFRAREAERAALDYKAQAQAELRRNPRKVTHIGELAKRDGVTLPYNPANMDAPTGEKRPGNYRDGSEPPPTAAPTPEQVAREERNREAWHRLAAKHEELVDKTIKGVQADVQTE